MKLLRYLPRFRKARRELNVLAQREAWPRTQIEQWQLERLNTLWQHATRHTDHYRRLAANHDLPDRFLSLAEFQTLVPVLRKTAVRQAPQDFLSEAAERGGWQRTGGSTGLPMGIYWGHEAHRELLRGKYRMADMWGVDMLDRQVFLWGHSGSFAPGMAGLAARARRPLEDALRGRLRLSAYRMGERDLTGYVRRIEAFRTVYLYGYSTAIYLLAREAATAGFRCDALKMVVMSGEPAYPGFVDEAQRAFRAPAVIEYGATECGLIASEWPDRTLRVREDMVLAETVERPDGMFDIVVTVLGNPSFPLIRYAIEDMTDVPLQSPEIGFSRLGHIGGRSNDLLVSRTGRFVHSLGVKHVFEHLPGVRRFQARQQASGHLEVSVETDDGGTAFDVPDVETRLSELLEGYPVTVESVGTIACTPAGKHRWVTSELATERMQPTAQKHVAAVAG